MVAKKVEDGTTTQEILEWIDEELSTRHPRFEKQINLRKALSMIPPAPEFEAYIQRLFMLEGYNVSRNKILRGLCCEHEVDGIIEKNDKRWFVETKHHYEDHTLTKLDIPRIAYAILEDLQKGHEKGVQSIQFTGAIIVSNTKMSRHARKYAECYNLHYMGWNTPKGKGLESLIQKHQFLPITVLRDLKPRYRDILFRNKIFTLNDIINTEIDTLRKTTGISRQKLQKYIDHAIMCLNK